MAADYLIDHILRALAEAGPAPGAAEPSLAAQLVNAFRLPDGAPDVLRCAELLADGRGPAEDLLAEALRRAGGTDAGPARAVPGSAVTELIGWDLRLTGAEAVAILLRSAGVTTVFGYPGTSELALCDAVDRADGIRLVNGRGDKESAFMAAGASLLQPNRGAAILHGARGLTNAAGAVADARRNEAGTMLVVGLPSCASARFLPPHGEADLLGGMSAFADWCWQAPAVPPDPAGRRQAARRFVAQFRHGLTAAAEPPHRPALFGIPQDVAEGRWIAVAELTAPPAAEPAIDENQPALEAAVRALGNARQPVFLIDDYALRHAGIRPALDAVSRAVGGAVLQLRYRRGPMLFERLRRDEVANFVGWLNQFSPAHEELLDGCDLLVTVEDRNIYERVAGRLPGCRKLAINTDPEKVLKNEYLEAEDILIAGHPAEVLANLARQLRPAADAGPAPWFQPAARLGAVVTPEPPSARVLAGRRAIAQAIAGILAEWDRPVLVDDSQMFGGLLAEHYGDFPAGLRVFGGHGGFVGGGLAQATGLGIADPGVRVMCTLGDQAFTNSFQGLVAAVQQQAQVLYLVCNNGESVSLRKQAAASYGASARSYLSNVSGFAYCALAAALGIQAEQVAVPVGGDAQEVDEAVARLSASLRKAAAVDGPSLVELVLPAHPEVWRGIWLTQGFERTALAVA